MRVAKFQIEGMSCGHCVSRVTSVLKGLPGVEVVSVAVGSADVQLDPTKTSAGAVAAAVTSAGYPTTADHPGELSAAIQGCGSGCGCGTK